MTAQDKLLTLLGDWHSEYCTSLSAGCDHFADPSVVLSTEAAEILDEHAHELAEKIRAWDSGDVDGPAYSGINHGRPYASCGDDCVSAAAALIDPEVNQ